MTPGILAAAGLGWLWRASGQASILVLQGLMANGPAVRTWSLSGGSLSDGLSCLRLASPLATDSAWSVFHWVPAEAEHIIWSGR